MHPQIRLLSELTINQIAAGEVIESPASVVKELVENAIDAGATLVRVEILAGGFQCIKVSDNGSGMSPEDATLCLQRHATSKIVSAEDLFSLTTMGFRGEALASIAAISKTRLFTALANAEAVDLEVEGGKILNIIPGARAQGTTIEVRSLFYNVPARKKFQKSSAASSAEITKVMTQLSLAHPEVGFEFVQQNRCYFSLPAASGEDFLTLLKERAQAVLSLEFVPSCRDFSFCENGYSGQGLIAEPSFARHNRSGQSLFVNRRPIFCPAIQYAIRDAYGTRLSSERHPVYLLHLSVPPQLVDVNVHPQKKEIRLREEGVVRSALHVAVNAALGAKEPVEASMQTAPSFFIEPVYSDFSSHFVFKEEVSSENEQLPLEPLVHVIGTYKHYALLSADGLPSFVLHKQPGGVVWIDLSAAQARIQFDRLVFSSQGKPSSQGLLLPSCHTFSKAEAQLLEMHLEVLQMLGIQIRKAGECTFIIEGIPPFIQESQVRVILEEMLGEFSETSSQASFLQRCAVHLTRACCFRKSFYSLEEARLIVQALLKTSDSIHCPHGKKILSHIWEEEIENYFA